MGEPKPARLLALQLEYRFDRLLAEKLAQVYQALVPPICAGPSEEPFLHQRDKIRR